MSLGVDQIHKDRQHILQNLQTNKKGVSDNFNHHLFLRQAQENLRVLKQCRTNPFRLLRQSGLKKHLSSKKQIHGHLEEILNSEYLNSLSNHKKLERYIYSFQKENHKILQSLPLLDQYRLNLQHRKKGILEELNHNSGNLTERADPGRSSQETAMGSSLKGKERVRECFDTLFEYGLAELQVEELKQRLSLRAENNRNKLKKLGRFKRAFENIYQKYGLQHYKQKLEQVVNKYSRKRRRVISGAVSLMLAGALSAGTMFSSVSPKSLFQSSPSQLKVPKQYHTQFPPSPSSLYLFQKVEGKIPVEMFHYVSNKRNRAQLEVHGINPRYIVSAKELRKHLQELYERGFRPISIEEFSSDLSKLPTGTKPILFTIDDATYGQFDFISPKQLATSDQRNSDLLTLHSDGDTYILDPDCFVAILREFNSSHPDFRGKAAFAVDFSNTHNTGYQKPFFRHSKKKLNMLLDWGFEIINHGYAHKDYSQLSIPQIKEDAGKALRKFEEYLGYRAEQVKYFAFPYGAVPEDPRALKVLKDFTYQNRRYSHQLLFGAWGGSANTPYQNKNTLIIPRIEVRADTFKNLIYNRSNLYQTPQNKVFFVPKNKEQESQ